MELDLVIKLREARRLRGLSQKDAARLSGVGVKTISSYETGARIGQLKVSQLQRLLRAYAIAPADFFGDAFELEVTAFEHLGAPSPAHHTRDPYERRFSL